MKDHKHGKNFAYGKREECPRCIAEDAALEKARQHYAEQLRQSEYVKADELQVDDQGIVEGQF